MEKILSDLDVLMVKIDEAMKISNDFEKKINDLKIELQEKMEKGEDTLKNKNDITNRENDKKEFDEMTVNALKKAYKDLQTARERELEEFKNEYEKRKQAQEARKERLAAYAKEFVSKPDNALKNKIEMCEAKIKAEDKSMQIFLKESVEKRVKMDDYSKKIDDYAKKLGVEEELSKISETNKEEPKEASKPKQSNENTNNVSVKKPAVKQEQMDRETLRKEEETILKGIAHLSSIRFSAETNTYICDGIDKDGNEVSCSIQTLNGKERKSIKREMKENDGADIRKKMDPNIYRILTSLGVFDKDGNDISTDVISKDFSKYINALAKGKVMEEPSLNYDFREDETEKKLGLFAKLRAHRDARHHKEVATIINKKGVAKLHGEKIELLDKRHGKFENMVQQRSRGFYRTEDPTKAALDAYKAHIADPARNVKNYDGKSK